MRQLLIHGSVGGQRVAATRAAEALAALELMDPRRDGVEEAPRE